MHIYQKWNITFEFLVKIIFRSGKANLRKALIAAIIMMLISRAVNISPPFLIKAIIEDLQSINIHRESINPHIYTSEFSFCLLLIVTLAAVKILYELFCWIRDDRITIVASEGASNISRALYQHILKQPFAVGHAVNVGLPISLCQRSRMAVEDLLRLAVAGLGPTVIEIFLLFMVFWLAIGFKYSIVLLIFTSLYTYVTIIDMNKRISIRSSLNQCDRDIYSFVARSVLSIETVKSLNADKHQYNIFNSLLDDYIRSFEGSYFTLSKLNLKQSIVLIFASTSLLAMMLLDILAGRAAVGDFVLLNVALIQVFIPLQNLGMQYRVARQSIFDLEETISFLNGPTEPHESASKPNLVISAAELVLTNVTYAHCESKAALYDISLRFSGGQITCLLGPSGVGKSTLARLITRLLEPGNSQIFIDNQDITRVTRRSVRDAVTYVPQEGSLFEGSLRENIAFGNWATDDTEILKVLRAVQLEELVDSLPQGLDTRIGDRGLKLSGGERQRVSIARCLLRDSPIVILDEVTSALDLETERCVLQAVKQWRSGKTTVMICHRLTALEVADWVVIMSDEQAPTRGTHNELLECSDVYRRYIEAHLSFLAGTSASFDYPLAEMNTCSCGGKRDESAASFWTWPRSKI